MNKGKLYYMQILPLLVLAIIAYKLINQTEVLHQVYRFLIALFTPLIWAGVIAYLLNPPLGLLEQRLHLSRFVSVLIIYTLLILLLIGVIIVIVPIIASSISDIVRDLPAYAEAFNNWTMDRLQDLRSFENFIKTYNLHLDMFSPEALTQQLSEMTDNLKSFAVSMGRTLFDFTSSVFKFIMGLILSIYILTEKESHAKQLKRVIRAYFGEQKAQRIFFFFQETDAVFGKYLVGKTIDSLIIGAICFVGLSLLGVRYSVLFSFIVGLTNMIPYFGPFIGAAPTIVVTLMYSPLQALWVALFILILQQLDGNFIGPMILGERVGMSPFWIIIAIVFGGGLFGVPGMLLGVPVAAVIRNIINRHVDKVLKDADVETS